jgi:hypothetical protein
MFDGGEVGWGVVGSDAAFVIAEDHVHDPVQAPSWPIFPGRSAIYQMVDLLVVRI